MKDSRFGARAAVVGVLALAGIVVAIWALRRAGPPSPGPANPGFREQAGEAGIDFRMGFLPGEQGEKFKINLYDHGCGVVAGDYDGDGRDDIYFLNQLGGNALYRNRGDGTFADVTETAGVRLADRISVGAVFADYDNDGDQDLYVTSTRGGNVLFRNQGDGTFADVTQDANLTLVAHSQTAAFFDYDNDGRLDLFVTNTARWTTNRPTACGLKYYPGLAEFMEMATSPKEYNVLYHNEGNGTFADVTDKAGLKGLGWGGDCAVFDADEDGRLDLVVTNMFGRSQFYRNRGDGTFADETQPRLGRVSWGAIGARAFDANGDGRLDLLITDMHSDMWLPVKDEEKYRRTAGESVPKKFKYLMGALYDEDESNRELERQFADAFRVKYDETVFGNTLFLNQGGGTFKEVSDEAGVETFWPWGIANGDFDNDGDEDVFLPSGMGYPGFYWPNALMMNDGGTFADRAREEGIEPPPGGEYLPRKIGGKPAARSSRSAAVASFSGDGRLDLVVNNFNDRAYLFRNQFPKQNHVAFRLRGTKSNRDAVGALVRVYAGPRVWVRQVQAAGGYLSQSSKTLHFGLGDVARIDRVEIRWPSGARQEVAGPEVNRTHEIVEP